MNSAPIEDVDLAAELPIDLLLILGDSTRDKSPQESGDKGHRPLRSGAGSSEPKLLSVPTIGCFRQNPADHDFGIKADGHSGNLQPMLAVRKREQLHPLQLNCSLNSRKSCLRAATQRLILLGMPTARGNLGFESRDRPLDD